MIRRVIEALHDPETVDDRDYYGNKRLELLILESLYERKISLSNLHQSLVSFKGWADDVNPI